MRTFRLLTADEIECRIAEIDKDGRYVSLLLYKTARTDAALLDETYTPLNWACDYRCIDGKMYCGIGIYNPERQDWVWKWNVGTESNTEAEKGQASDALKRAGFVWGIGTELYSSPRITIWPDKCDIKEYNGKRRCHDTFHVSRIEYDEKENISFLEIFNDKKGCVAFTWPGKQAPANNTKPAKEAPQDACKPQNTGTEQNQLPPAGADGYWHCEKCQKVVGRTQKSDGTYLPPKEVVSIGYKRFRKVLCADCIKDLTELKQAANV